MSLVAFQTALGLLVSGHSTNDKIEGLTDDERHKVLAVASDPGISTITMLYESWRMTKILSLLPLTVEVLDDGLADLLDVFWRLRPARGPYFGEECVAFLDFVEQQASLAGTPFLADVMAFERARIEMRDAVGQGHPHVTARVRLDYHPTVVFDSTRNQLLLEGAASCPTILVGDLSSDGTEQWSIDGEAAASVAVPALIDRDAHF